MTMLRTVAVLALVPGLAGCALWPRAVAWVDFRAVQTSEVQRFSRQDGYYNSAVAAIERRDYAAALDLLQAARATKPDDVRVLNAFAVVYDKLGRFDLSARYYEQAQRLDPASPVLARNIAYSATLQTRAAGSVTVRLTVTDSTGLQASAVHTLAIGPAGGGGGGGGGLGAAWGLGLLLAALSLRRPSRR